MINSATLPRAQAQFVDNAGRPTREFYDFLRGLITLIDSANGDSSAIADLLARVEALENEGASSAIIQGLMSVAVNGTLAGGVVQLLLQGDVNSPGNTAYYGTGPDGARGWAAIASALTATQDGIELVTDSAGVTDIRPDDDLAAVEGIATTGIAVRTGDGTWTTRGLLPGSGINITFSNGVAGDPTIAHADTSSVANISASFTGSTVPGEISFTFDQFGHVLTRTITGRQLDHNDLGALQGGAPGQYYHLTESERDSVNTAVQSIVAGEGITVDETAPTNPVVTNADKGSTAVAAHVAEPDPHPQYALPAGTDAQFYRGDKTLANYVSESLGAGGNWAGDISLVSGGRTLWAQGDTSARFACYSAKDAGAGSQFIGARSGGTMDAPTPPGNATTLFELYGSSYIGPGWAYPAALYFYTTEAHSTTARGTRIQFSTTLQGTTSLVAQLHIGNAGARATEPGGNNTHILGSSSLRWMEIHGRDYHQYGARLETGVVSPAQLTADTANWAITGLGTAAVVRASTNASRTVSGIASPTAGQTVLLCNVGSFDLILAHDTTSTAANRFLCPGSVNFTLNPNDSVRLWYDTVSARWRVIGA